MTSLVLSIPSPSFNSLELGPLTFTMYGLMIGLGIIAAAVINRPRALERGLHPDTPLELLMWVVPAGVIGARLYHVLTDWVPISDWHKVWEGGLGVPGAIGGGLIAGLFFVKRRGLDRNRTLDAMIVGVPLAQAIGRWGNWWNQELFGEPTELPWALEIDEAHRPADFSQFETFHPTFLYESLWNLGLVAFLIWIDRRRVLKPGRLIWVYAAGYAIGRLWIEMLRIDNATEVAGLRINLWTMGALLVVSLLVLRKSFLADGEEASLPAASSATAFATDDSGDLEDEVAPSDDESDESSDSQTSDSQTRESQTGGTLSEDEEE